MKKFWLKKGLMFLGIFIIAIVAFGALVMTLWNAILPAVLGVSSITFLQALGILLLSKILFGGFMGGCRNHRGHEWKNKMKQKWNTMTPDERDQLKTEWKNRCGGRWKMNQPDAATTE